MNERDSNGIVGHANRRAQLLQLIHEGRIPHTLLFAGPKGIGKSLIARAFASAILCQNSRLLTSLDSAGCGTCPSCRLACSKDHPDLMEIDCENRDAISAEATRELLGSIHLKPFMGSARVVLLTNAEDVPVQSANILLKSFEEPRPRTYFILTASNPSRLPPTLLSRCQVWFFDTLSPTEVTTIIHRQMRRTEIDLSDEQLAAIFNGSLDHLESLPHISEHFDEVRSLLKRIEERDGAALAALVKAHAAQKEKFETLCMIIRALAREQLYALRDTGRLTRWSVLLSNIITAERLAFDRNLNPQYLIQVILTTFMSEPQSRAPDALLEHLV